MDMVAFAEDVVGRMAKLQRHPTGNEDAQPDGPDVDARRGRRVCQLHGLRWPCVVCKREVEAR